MALHSGDRDHAQGMPDPKTRLSFVCDNAPRGLSWPSRSDLKRYAGGTEEWVHKDLEGSDLVPNKGNSGDKRRMQNRHVQRAFRARAKILGTRWVDYQG